MNAISPCASRKSKLFLAQLANVCFLVCSFAICVLCASCAPAIGQILPYVLQQYLVFVLQGCNITKGVATKKYFFMCSFAICGSCWVLVFRVLLLLVKSYHTRCNTWLRFGHTYISWVSIYTIQATVRHFCGSFVCKLLFFLGQISNILSKYLLMGRLYNMPDCTSAWDLGKVNLHQMIMQYACICLRFKWLFHMVELLSPWG